MRLEDKLYWGRFLGGIVMGVLTAILKLYEPTIILGIILAITAYVLSAIILRMMLPQELRARLGRNLYLSGAAAYAAMWVISLIITFNILQA